MRYNHLTLEERIQLQHCLEQKLSFRASGLLLGRDPTTLSREVKRYSVRKRIGSWNASFNNCSFHRDCDRKHLCDFPCSKRCKNCEQCYLHCPDYVKKECARLLKPPYVCTGCPQRTRCTLEKVLYEAKNAQRLYETILSESRSGTSFAAEEIEQMDALLAPGIKQGHSPYLLYTNHKEEMLFSERTLYRLIDQNRFSFRNLDLPAKVRYRPRKKTVSHKVDRGCRKGRTYKDYLAYCAENPDVSVVEMDTVLNRPGEPVLLSLWFSESCLHVYHLRERNDAKSVTDFFVTLANQIGKERYKALFPVLLTDNGSEFSNPEAIECPVIDGVKSEPLIRVFYCDPGMPSQKAGVEGNHALFRRIVPKRLSMRSLTVSKVVKINAHLNSLLRKKLKDRSAYESFSFFHDESLLQLLGISKIPASEVILTPELLK